VSIMSHLIGQPKANWGVCETSEEVHVIPLRGATHELVKTCWCFPLWEHHDRDLVVHNEAN
jgi:hypothetical protein